MGLCKPIVRTLVLGGIATGAAVVIAGPERVQALAGQARTAVVAQLDEHIDDPVALRAQLKDLEREYPGRISTVRTELTSLNDQITALQHDGAVADRVVAMASSDLSELQQMIELGQNARTQSTTAIISVKHAGKTLALDKAYAKATELAGTVSLYQAKAQSAERDLGFLREQQGRLAELLEELETEHATFLAQLWQLEGQIEMIGRNDKLIAMMEDRQATIDELERFEASSLDQVSAKMNRVRAEQEAKLESLATRKHTTDYEDMARATLQAEQSSRKVYERVIESPEFAPVSNTQPQAVLITPKDLDADTSVAHSE